MQISLLPSDHASRGMITVIRSRLVVKCAAPAHIGTAEDRDVWSIHSDDVPAIKRVLETKNIIVRVMT